MRLNRNLALLSLSLSLFVGTGVQAEEVASLVQRFGAAFNAHDSKQMAAMVTDDFELYYVNDAGKSELSTSGAAALQKEMTGYFKNLPNVKSTLDQQNQVGKYVSFRETARWTDGSGKQRTQASLAVYQVEGKQIRRAWYYPASSGK